MSAVPALTILSGGQTGVDRAALDVAAEQGLSRGGWCPRGRLAEDGPIDAGYPLRETPRRAYAQRTEWNVRDSDATLILTRGAPDGGTALTIGLARRLGRPLLVIDLEGAADPARLGPWLARHSIGRLNVAGPRESRRPGIGAAAREWLREALQLPTSAE